ncbi:MAG: hypothetical protein AAFY88_23520, partial [Acidobacteriota bacterium]
MFARALMSLALILIPAAVVAQPSVDALQGSVVRWASAAAESCGMDGRTWRAVDAVCYFPIDFKRAPGRVE